MNRARWIRRAAVPRGRPGWRGRTTLRALAAVTLLVVLSGCSLRDPDARDDPFRPDSDGPVRIEVQNHHFQDARIYALWDGAGRRRIGLVTGNTTQTLEVEWGGDNLRVEVDLIAAGGFVTGPIAVWPGETVVLRIPAN